ncbi:MAG: hypothetical protein AAF560_27455, partial [Acidobacteriota bacterium]
RIHEPTYFSPNNAPAGATSLCADVTCFEDDEVWCDATLAERVAQELVRLKILPEHAHEIAGVHRVAHAYPVYELGYRDVLQRVQTRFSEIDGLETIGRSGTFTYLNMDGCFAAGSAGGAAASRPAVPRQAVSRQAAPGQAAPRQAVPRREAHG